MKPPAASADDTVTIPQIVISATRSPALLSQIASSVTVITADDIERRHDAQVADALRMVPGLSVAGTGGAGQTTRVFMRGTNSNHVLVLMDGVPLNDPSDPNDAFDFSNLSTDNIERIEVLRGAQSTLYGSQAIGGVIQIITKKGQGAPKYSGFAEYGRYNTSRAGVSASGEADEVSYSLSAGGTHSSGQSAIDSRFGGRERDGSSIGTFSGNVASKITQQFTAKLNLRYNRNDTQFDTPNAYSPRINDDPFPDNDSRQINGRIAGEYSGLSGKWVQEIGLSYLTLNRSQLTEFQDASFNYYFGHQQYLSWREKADWVHRVSLIDHHTFTFGAESWSDHYKFNSVLNSLSLGERNVDNQALFIDDQAVYGNFFVNTGIRADLNQSFGRHSTWKIAPGYFIEATGTRLKASYGTGFVAPSLFSLYDAAYGNPALKPETSKSYDAGFEQHLLKDRVVFGATLFRNDIDNQFNTVEVAPMTGVYKYVNIGKARTQGVETTLEVRPAVDWKLAANYTFTQADNRSDDVRLKRRPKHVASAQADWQYSVDGNAGVDLRYTSVSFDYDFAFNPANVRSFTTVDVYANHKLSRNITAYGRIDNLLDKHYEEVYGYSEPGASVFGGIKVNY